MKHVEQDTLFIIEEFPANSKKNFSRDQIKAIFELLKRIFYLQKNKKNQTFLVEKLCYKTWLKEAF